jgi:hypothetical protein
MIGSRLHRDAGAATGLVFVALLVAAYLSAPPMPVAGTPAGTLVAYVSANSEALERSWFLACGPDLFFAGWFLGVVVTILWDAGTPHHMLAAGFVSALLAGGLLTAAGVSWGLFVYLAPQLGSSPLVLVLAESRHFAEGAVSFPVAAAAAAFSLATWGSGRAWRVVSALGIAAAALELANGFDDFAADGVTDALGPISFGVLMLWIATLSLASTVRRGWFAFAVATPLANLSATEPSPGIRPPPAPTPDSALTEGETLPGHWRTSETRFSKPSAVEYLSRPLYVWREPNGAAPIR